MASSTPEPAASVVIPAYQEGRVIGRCLEGLARAGTPPLDVVVAANGCTDDTVVVARRYAGVTVLDLSRPGKAGALNAGDAAARTFPRIFLDADITLSPDALGGMISALSVSDARVAAPHVRFRTEHCSWAVRAYYDVYRELPYVRSGLVGLGVYGLSEAGRRRFSDFPALEADDLFVQRLFTAEERVVTDGWFDVHAPRDLRNLVAVRTRVARGNAALARAGDDDVVGGSAGDFSTSTTATLRSLFLLVLRRPRLLPGAVVYVGVVLAGRRAARAAASTPSTAWDRDESTR